MAAERSAAAGGLGATRCSPGTGRAARFQTARDWRGPGDASSAPKAGSNNGAAAGWQMLWHPSRWSVCGRAAGNAMYRPAKAAGADQWLGEASSTAWTQHAHRLGVLWRGALRQCVITHLTAGNPYPGRGGRVSVLRRQQPPWVVKLGHAPGSPGVTYKRLSLQVQQRAAAAQQTKVWRHPAVVCAVAPGQKEVHPSLHGPAPGQKKGIKPAPPPLLNWS